MVNKGAEFHFWYVYMIFGLILLIQFLTPWTEKKDKNSLLVFILIWLLWSLFTYTFRDYIKSSGLTYLLFGSFSEYIGYLILGYYLHIKDRKKYDWMIGVGFLIVSISYGYYISIDKSYEQEKFVQFFLNYKSWNVILMSAGIFLIVKQIKINTTVLKILDEVGKYSFGVYLAHIIVRNVLVARYFDFLNFEDYSFLIVKSLIVLLFSYVIVKIINKTPFIGKYISG